MPLTDGPEVCFPIQGLMTYISLIIPGIGKEAHLRPVCEGHFFFRPCFSQVGSASAKMLTRNALICNM